ncbi:MAG TPA: DUF502 domain-containing protein [Planctomycetaceae bacterium]|jgi:uncharacterized membrane protein
MSTAPVPTTPAGSQSSASRRSATYFFLRGVAITLPPVLTLLILLWAANGFNTYVIHPINTVVRYALANWKNDIRTRDQLVPPPRGFPRLEDWNRNYLVTPDMAEELGGLTGITPELFQSDDWNRKVFVPMGTGTDPGQFVPLADHDLVFKYLRPQPLPTTAIGLYMDVVSIREFSSTWLLSALSLSMAIIAMVFIGRLVTARIGKWFVHKLEGILVRVPLVRNVYSTVKQVTDFVLSEREVEFQRVVAIEYPRAGSWTLGFVTGEGMLDCSAVVREPMVTVLVPTSPVPAGGFTVMVSKSSVIDLNLTIDQAVQFVVSCGVLIPPHQVSTPQSLERELNKRLESTHVAAGAAAAVTNGSNP